MRRLKGELRNIECRSRGWNPIDEQLESDRAGFHPVIQREGDGVRAGKLGCGRDSVHSYLEYALSNVIRQTVHQEGCRLPGDGWRSPASDRRASKNGEGVRVGL